MSAFSTSEFATLLDELIAANEKSEAMPVRPTVPFGFVGPANPVEELWSNVPGDVVADLYRRSAGEEPVSIENPPGIEMPEPAPKALPSIDPGEIARELTAVAADNPRDLDRIRREFAFANHPDRVEPALRERAEIRMRIANMLIDQLKRRILTSAK